MKRLFIILTLMLSTLIGGGDGGRLLAEKVLLNNDWTFALGNRASMEKDFTHGTEYFTYYCKVRTTGSSKSPIMPEFDDAAWQHISLPHDWVVDLPFAGEASHSHGYKCIGWKYPENSVGWYRKHFTIPSEDRGKHISVEFEGVFRNWQLFCNGYYIGSELSGYKSRTFEISEVLNYGGDNVITVRCDASVEEGWYYEGAGIYRNVWLHTNGSVQLKPYTLCIRTDKPRLEVSYELEYATPATEVRYEVRDMDGNIVSDAVADMKRWSIASPYLYTLCLDIYDNGEKVSTYTQPFGVRDAVFDKDRGFLLNGERVQLKGCDLHLDAAGVGTGVPDELWRYKLQTLKSYGFNAIRCSHNPASPSMLSICDELGMVVIDENRLLGIGEEQMALLENMIRRDRNHPCVILWSVGNEEWAVEYNEVGTLMAKKMSDRCHLLDPTRPTTYGACSGQYPNYSVDVFGYNYIVQNPILQNRKEYPNKTGVGTEETTGCGTRGKYVTDKAEGWMLSPNRDPALDSLQHSIERGWKFYKENSWLGGLFYWTGTDYRGEPNPMAWPATGSQFGIFDYCCYPKDEAFYLKSWWTDDPVLHVCGQVGTDVTVYSNCEEVELFHNGKSCGKKKMPTDGHLSWTVLEASESETPASATLKAVGYRNGKKLLTETHPETIKKTQVLPSKTTMKADGQDVVIIDVITADESLHVTVDGATLLGWGNGNPGFKTKERTSDNTADIPVFSNRAQIIIRSIAGHTAPARITIDNYTLSIKNETI